MVDINISKKKSINSSIKAESIQAETEALLKKVLSFESGKVPEKNILLSNKKIRLIWTEKGKLYELIDILHKRKFIKTKKDLYSLFETPYLEKKVKWNSEKKYHLAYLFFRMYQEKHILIVGGKGYYKYIEENFLDFNEIPFKKNSLKNIKLKILRRADDYSFICKEIEEIISKYLEF